MTLLTRRELLLGAIVAVVPFGKWRLGTARVAVPAQPHVWMAPWPGFFHETRSYSAEHQIPLVSVDYLYGCPVPGDTTVLLDRWRQVTCQANDYVRDEMVRALIETAYVRDPGSWQRWKIQWRDEQLPGERTRLDERY